MINIFHLWLFSAPNHPGKPLHPWTMWEKSAPNHPDKPLHQPPPFRAKPLWKQHISKMNFPFRDIIICDQRGIIFKIFLDMHITWSVTNVKPCQGLRGGGRSSHWSLTNIHHLFHFLHFLAWFYDVLNYNKIGLWSFWFLKIDRVHYLYDHDLRQKWPLPFLIIQNLTEYIFWLDSLMVQPTTKMALAVPDSSKFDWVHFLARFFEGLTYDKIGLWSFWFFKIDRVHYF